MRLIYITDIHGSFNKVADLLVETQADMYIISGDLIDIPFYNIDSAITYYELQTEMNSTRKKMGMEDMILEDFVDKLMEVPDIRQELLLTGSQYQQYTIRARRVMQQKYKELENIISFHTSSRICVLPGNYDMDLKFTALHERDLHLKWFYENGFKIAGYGGADVRTTGIPEKYIISYKAGIGVHDRNNELYTFLKAIKPQIIAVHQPAHGILDRISYRGPSGSPALRNYCDNNDVSLCLSGHIHSDWGCVASNNTIFLNPSNFGEVTTIKGEVSEGGFFFQVEFNDTAGIEKITFRKLVQDSIYDLAEYTYRHNRLIETIIDAPRMNARHQQENYDLKDNIYSHVPEIQLIKDVKNYYLMFQERKSQDPVDKLEEFIEFIKGKLDDIAFDLIGTIAADHSGQNPDISLVLYVRCDIHCSHDPHSCANFNETHSRIKKQLADTYTFEIIDCIDLNTVERSIRERDYECEETQRFIAYRTICMPINYQVIAPVEQMLNADMEFRKEMEGSIRSFLKIFVNTSKHFKSFEKYELRLRSLGIKIPNYIRKLIRKYMEVSGQLQ